MCGLVGIAGALQHSDEDVMKHLLFYDYWRGQHSTGLAAVRNTKEIKIAKVPSHPFDLFDMGSFKAALSGYNSIAFMGHNRHATRGAINSANTHPFQVDHITGAHNGTLEDESFKDLKKELKEEFATDSLAIITAIAKMGVKDTISMLQGSWSLVYYNEKNNTLNFIRNNERPMWLAYSDDFKVLYYSSERRFIHQSIADGGDKRKLYFNKDNHCYFEVPENRHISFDLDELKKGGKSPPKPKAAEMKGRERVPFTGSYSNTGQRWSGWRPAQNNNVLQMRRKSTTPSPSGHNAPAVLIGSDEQPYGGAISETEFDALAQWGCSHCSKEIKFGDQGITIHKAREIILCSDCTPRQQTQVVIPHVPNRLTA